MNGLADYLQAFSPPELEAPEPGNLDSWWRHRVQQAAIGELPPDTTYWLMVWSDLLVQWAAESKVHWGSEKARALDALLLWVESQAWPEKRG